MNDFLKGYGTQMTGGSPAAGPSQSVLEAMGRDAARAQQSGPAPAQGGVHGGATQEFSLKATLKAFAAGLVFLGLMLANNAVGGPEGLSIALAVPMVLLLGFSVVLLFVAGVVGSVIGVAGVFKARWFKFGIVGAACGALTSMIVPFPVVVLAQVGAMAGILVAFLMRKKP